MAVRLLKLCWLVLQWVCCLCVSSYSSTCACYLVSGDPFHQIVHYCLGHPYIESAIALSDNFFFLKTLSSICACVWSNWPKGLMHVSYIHTVFTRLEAGGGGGGGGASIY